MSSRRSHRDIIPVSHGNRTLLPNLPPRKGRRPMTRRAALHLQCDGHGPQIYLERLVKEVSSWPGVESLPSLVAPLQWHAMWVEEALASPEPSAFIYGHEFAHVLLGSTATIHVALPLPSAHWAIVRGWAEPHFLNNRGLISPGVVLIYTPRDEDEYEICYRFFNASFQSALAPETVCLSPSRKSPARHFDGVNTSGKRVL
jgi:hypothetical protein